MNNQKIILQLCADTGSDTLPYQENGYDVRLIGSKIGVENYHPPSNVYGIIANPPCTHFSIARTHPKLPRDLKEGMRLVKECLRIIWECQYQISEKSRSSLLKFWAIENPSTGLLKGFLGNPTYQYCPSEFGAGFTKRTALWGLFNPPIKPFMKFGKLPFKSRLCGDKTPIMDYRDTQERMEVRSRCYYNFAKAFYIANP